MSFHFEATTDSTGKFSFEKVPPGPGNVFRMTMRAQTGFESHDTSLVVHAGAVTQVVLGGGGRPIIGKAVLAGATSAIDWKSVSVRLRLKTADEPGPRPKRDDYSSRSAYVAAMDHFFEAARAQSRFGAFCDGDGAFRLQDIPAGSYQLEIKLHGFKPNSVGQI